MRLARDIADYYDALQQVVDDWEVDPYFVTITGVDLYGFPSEDSDYDLRGAFALPLSQVLGLSTLKGHVSKDTVTYLHPVDGLDMDGVFYDVGKLVGMIAEGNGAILEEVYSPLVLAGHEFVEPLRLAASGCFSRRLFYHYNGFSRSQIAKLRDKDPKRCKTLLYIYRILMTGIHVLETGELEMNVWRLNEHFKLSFLPDLVFAKVEELSPLPDMDLDEHFRIIKDLQRRLRHAYRHSPLPHNPICLAALNDFLVEVRLQSR